MIKAITRFISRRMPGRLPDWQIEELVRQNVVVDVPTENINPASLDVRIARHFIYKGKAFTKDTVRLMPGSFILAQTIEMFYLPDNISAQFLIKSSMGRMGLTHALAGWCDPGWKGSVLTMELYNWGHEPIVLKAGQRVGQMVFERLVAPVRRSYKVTGRYNNDVTVMAAKEEKDIFMQKM